MRIAAGRTAHPIEVAVVVLAAVGCGERAAATGSTGQRPAAPVASEPPPLRLPGDVRPLRYAVDLTIVPSRPVFQGRISIAAEASKPVPVVWLNATGLAISRATLNGRGAHVVAAKNGDLIGLTTGSPVPAGPLAIDVEYGGAIDRDKSRGIYAEKEGEEWYAYTFFESIDARRAFPCFDQPDAKVPWRLTFHVEKGHVALANAPVESEADEAGGMKKVAIAETRPLPSYLVAFVVGPFDVVEGGAAGRAGTPLRFVVPRGRSGELRYAREVTPRVVAALEDYFDMDYPYGKLDVAVVPRYWGTMEHPGIVAMGQPLTLIEPGAETRQRREAYTGILAHELAHYWFGDVVTPVWWDDTWLNEALATWMDAIIADRAEPGWKFLDHLPDRVGDAMQADENPSTKAIRQPVETKEAIESSFDASITYYKGSTVLRMFESWVGPEAWRTFIRAYIARHAWRNASSGEFLAAMRDELGAEVADAFKTFLDQPGVPLVEHELACRGDAPAELTLAQRRALPAGTTESAPRTWQVPVCVRYGVGREAHRSCTLLASPDGTLPLEGACPTWLVMNAGGVGYYRSRYTRDEVTAVLSRRSPGRPSMAERRVLMSDVGAAVARDDLSIADAMAMVPLAIADRDERIQQAVWSLIGALRADALDDDTYVRFQRWVLASWGPTARKLGWRRRPGDSDERQALRASALSWVSWAGDRRLRAEAGRLARAWLADPSAIEDDIADEVLAAAARAGDAALFDEVLAAARSAPDRVRQQRLLSALGGFGDPTLVARALGLVLAGGFDLRESRAILLAAAGERETRAQAWSFIQEHVDALLGGMRSDEASRFIGRVGGLFCDDGKRREVAALFEPPAATIEGARYELAQALDEIDRCVRTQARIAPSAAAFLGARVGGGSGGTARPAEPGPSRCR